MSELEKKWSKTLELVRSELNEVQYETWIVPLVPKRIDEKQNILYVAADNILIINRLNERYRQLVEGAVKISFEKPLNIVGELEEKKESKPAATKSTADVATLDEEYYLNPKFSFENFIVGKNNEFAHSVALAVAETPGKNYNPLFIYGGSGLGKTHLMHAIGHYILKNHKRKKVLYISSEMFTNELINAINTKNVPQFKRKYRNVDVLLIDDIQFIEGKEATEEEFFHTFETLYNKNKQIVISSDRPPQKLTSLDERLRSRFLWNVTADVQPPDFETRVAILRSKATIEGIDINEDVSQVINMIAERIKYNVRMLEGAFTRIVSFSALMNKPIDMSLAKNTLNDIISSSDNVVTIESIKTAVSKHYGITIKEIDSGKRSRNLAFPRQIAMYLCKEMTDNSLPQIGKAFGGRDHTTVLHACKKISSSIEEDSSLQETIDYLMMNINNN